MSENAYTIGIDIGGTNLRFALVDAKGRIVRRSRTASGIGDGREAFCSRLVDGILEMNGAAAAEGICVAGIGVGVPGLVGSDGTIRSSVNMQPLVGCNLADFLSSRLDIPVACGNDANLIALGEQLYGAGRGMKSFVVITIGTGLGSGLILDGRLWTGCGGFAAEFGHVTVVPDGLECPCGNHGCLEQYVSAGAIVRAFSARENSSAPLDAAGLAALARDGNRAAIAAYEDAGRHLGIALASLVNTLNLEAAIVGGGVAASHDLLFPAIRSEIDRRCFRDIRDAFSVLPGRLGDDSGLLGASALFHGSVIA